jgi:homospermidine synthase
MTDEIIDGRDVLGLTYYLESGEVFWIGSTLGIDEARKLFDSEFNDYVNATNTQVVAGYLSGIHYILELDSKNEKHGLMCPDELPYENLIEKQLPFLGDFVFEENQDFSLRITDNKFDTEVEKSKVWTFSNFLVEKAIIVNKKKV